MHKIGDAVRVICDGTIGAVIGVEDLGVSKKYTVLVNGRISTFFETQLETLDKEKENVFYTAKDVNALLSSRLILNPSISSLYSLNSAKIDYIPYQFRPVLKIVKSDSPRVLIADGVGVGKTIEAGLVLKELQARFDVKSVLIICPRPLITEKKWQNELKRFGEQFVHLDGKQLRYCIDETIIDDGEWPTQYQKCIIPYSLFDEALVCGTTDGGFSKVAKNALCDMTPFPKFDLVIIDEAHHIKNPNTYAYRAAQMFCDNADSVVLLTATPIQLGDRDLFVLLNLIRPDLVFDYNSFLHMSEPNPFINEAVRCIRGNKDNWKENALEALKTAGETPWGRSMYLSNPTYQKCIKFLQQKEMSVEERVQLISSVESLHTFAGIINRTRRRDIGAFTIRKPETLKVCFTDDQLELYNRLIETQANILTLLHGDQGIQFMMTTIMRQASSCIHGLRPFLETILKRRFQELETCGGEHFDGDEYGEVLYQRLSVPQVKNSVDLILQLAECISDKDNKLEALCSVVEGKQHMTNNRVMVFSSFRHTLQYLYEKLTERNIRVGIVHGGVKDEERVILRERFMLDRREKKAIDVLLFSEVGCEGLDYQFCDCMVNYDLPWNPQAIEQRIGRIDRNGQKSESVSIVNIITEGTIDCDIYERCLARIGVFNSSIGDSEQILGDITKEIYNIAEKYVLNPEERKEKLQQLQENEVRLMQEQQKMEDEKHAFFGLDLSESTVKKEIEDATNIHLSTTAICRLVEAYLEKRLGTESYILGEGEVKTLRLNAENRKELYQDYLQLPRQSNPVYKAWAKYLNDALPFEKITFDGRYAMENQDVVLIMPTHPLVRQALKCFETDTVDCNLSVKDKNISPGIYDFIVYEWSYKGVKDDSKIQVVTKENIPNSIILNSIYQAKDNAKSLDAFDEDALEALHYKKWTEEKNKHIEEVRRIVDFKKQSLTSSHNARNNITAETLKKATSEKIIKMKKAQMANQEYAYLEKMKALSDIVLQADIIATKLIRGKILVES